MNNKRNLEEKEESILDVWVSAMFGAMGVIGLGVLAIFILAGFQG